MIPIPNYPNYLFDETCDKVYSKYKKDYLIPRKSDGRYTLSGNTKRPYTIKELKFLTGIEKISDGLEQYVDNDKYLINRQGQLWSKEYKKFIGTWISRGYLEYNCGGHIMVHRALAKQYVSNPNNYKVVDHQRCKSCELINIENCTHPDDKKLNNNIGNLRWVSNSHNGSNQNSQNNRGSSKYTGIHFCNTKKKWIVKLRIDGKRIPIGSEYKTEEEARQGLNLYILENELDTSIYHLR